MKQSRKWPLAQCLIACNPSHVTGTTQIYARRLPTRESCNKHPVTEAITVLLSAKKNKEFYCLPPPQTLPFITAHIHHPHAPSPIISLKRELNCFSTSYLQSQLNGVSLKPIHQPEKSQLEHLTNTQEKINRKLNYTFLDISTPSGFSNSILGHYWVAALIHDEPVTLMASDRALSLQE